MKALVQAALHAEVKAYNPAHSFLVIGVSDRRLNRYLSQIPGLALAPKRDTFTFKDIEFTIDNGGDTGGDGLWIMPKDGRYHLNQLQALHEHIAQMIAQDPPTRGRIIIVWAELIASLLVCIGISFATLHTLTALSPWAIAVISLPLGAAMFSAACKWADI